MFRSASVVDSSHSMISAAISHLTAMKKCLSHRSILKEFNWLFFFTETQHAATLFIGNIRLLMFLCKFYDPLHILDIQCCYRES